MQCGWEGGENQDAARADIAAGAERHEPEDRECQVAGSDKSALKSERPSPEGDGLHRIPLRKDYGHFLGLFFLDFLDFLDLRLRCHHHHHQPASSAPIDAWLRPYEVKN